MSTQPNKASSPMAARVAQLMEQLQQQLMISLSGLDTSITFTPLTWLRDEGRHGGGLRYVSQARHMFNGASINTSQVHYDDEPHKKLGSATALSTIIHPHHPHAPSLHMHISWTEMKDGQGYWRMMADLNPSLPCHLGPAFTEIFKKLAPHLCEEGFRQGDQYFYIPALGRHRGICHFYLECYHSGNFENDFLLAQNCGMAVISFYSATLGQVLQKNSPISPTDRRHQLDYHSLYFLQVLTLDRGTTSGLLVHQQNDIGILGSLPSHVDRELLQSWVSKMPKPQNKLLLSLLSHLPNQHPCPISDDVKLKLANALRTHYQQHPEALNLQASAGIIAPTVSNHKS